MTQLVQLHPGAQRDQWRWRRRQLDKLRGSAVAEVAGRAERLDATDYVASNREVSRLTRELSTAHAHLAYDEEQIRAHAENYSRLAARIPDLERRRAFAESVPVDLPTGRHITDDGIMQRLADPLWWRRQLRKNWTRAAENARRSIGMVRKGKAPYASDDALRCRGAQRRKMRDYLERHQAVNVDTRDALPLDSLAEHSLSNPVLRRGEFMTRVRGLEELARDHGHVALFVTLTTPSRFHAELAAGGANPAFDKSTVRDGQRWLCRMWARTRAKLKRLEVLVYGFRVAEPHHDATSHWHGLFFIRQRDLDTVCGVLRGVYLSDAGSDAGAAEHRVKFERIDASKGSATGYLAKYIAKNIDGKGAIGNERSDETDERIADNTSRVDAWASVHGVRQFQEIGAPPVGIWREARRLRDRVADSDLERARDFADRGKYRAFVGCLGGIASGRRTNIRLERCDGGQRNRYGEARPPAVIGLRCASAVVLTRLHKWRIERKPCSGSALFSALGPVAITVRSGPGDNEPAGWTNPSETSQAPPQ